MTGFLTIVALFASALFIARLGLLLAVRLRLASADSLRWIGPDDWQNAVVCVATSLSLWAFTEKTYGDSPLQGIPLILYVGIFCGGAQILLFVLGAVGQRIKSA